MTLFYDETGNIRKFYLQKERKFNINNYKENFILGGIVIKDELPDRKEIEEELRNILHINPTAKKIKNRVIFQKNSSFIDCLNNPSFKIFINFLIEKNFFIHFQSLNLLYWAIVDIIDSIPDKRITYSIEYNRYLKDLLYKFSKRNIKIITSIFYKYSYTNILPESSNKFLTEIINCLLVAKNISKKEKKELYAILITGYNKELTFIQDNDSNILIDSFRTFYENRIKQFPYTTQILDIEKNIMKEMENNPPINFNNINYKWVKSIDDIYLQIADVFIGLFGKLKTYLNKHSIERINNDFNKLDEKAKQNLKLFAKLLIRNDQENTKWALNIDANTEIEKMQLVLNYIYF